MTPKQIYNLPVLRIESLNNLNYPAIDEIDNLRYNHNIIQNRAIVKQHYYRQDKYGDSFYLESVWFDDSPIMIVEYFSDDYISYITDKDLYFKLIDYMISISIRECKIFNIEEEIRLFNKYEI